MSATERSFQNLDLVISSADFDRLYPIPIDGERSQNTPQREPEMPNTTAPFVHVVLFEIHEAADPEDTDALITDIDTLLRPLPTVRHLERGKRADTAVRPIVLTDYDVGLLVLLDDKAGLDAYLTHPDHVTFATKWAARSRIRVMDFSA